MTKLTSLFMMVIFSFMLGCGPPRSRTSFSKDIVRNDAKYKCIVGFDLRNDRDPKAGILVQSAPTSSGSAASTVFLPFPSSSAGIDPDIFSSWGSTECCTWISYIQAPGNEGAYVLPVAPIFSSQPDDLSTLPGTLYLLRLGQERRFLYKYPNDSEQLFRRAQETALIVSPNAIAVALPTGPGGRQSFGPPISNPKPILDTGVAQFYPASGADAGTDHLEIRYYVSLTSREKALLKALAQLVAAVLPPLLGLIFIDPSDPARRRVKKIGLWIGVAFEIVVVAVLAWFVASNWGAEVFDTLSSLVSALLGAIFTAGVLYAKREVI